MLFPSASTGRAALSEGSQPRDHPASTLRLPIHVPPEVGTSFVSGKRRPCGFSALCVRVRPAHAGRLTFTHHTGPAAGHSPRSLFHAAFRYLLCRTLSRPGRVFLFAINPATLMGFVGALRSIPWPRVPASLRFIPTCRSSTRWRLLGSLIFTSLPVAEYLKLLPQVNEFQLRPAHRAHDSTGFWVLLPRTSQTACIAQFRVGIACALQAANPAMGFVGFSRACWMLCSQHA